MGKYDPKEIAIIAKGKDVTDQVIDLYDSGSTFTVVFFSKTYNYSKENIEICNILRP